MAWPGSLQEQSLMAASGEDEFTNFLEFGMHFPDLEGHGPGERQLQPPRSLPASASMMPTTTAEQEQLIRMDTDSLPNAHSSSSYSNRIMGDFPFDLSNHNQQSQPQGQIPSSYTSAPVTPAFYNQELAQPQIYHHPQQPPQKQQQQQQQQSHHGLPTTSQPYIPHGQAIIPPTPNSIELQGNAARYPAQVDENHELYDRYPHMNEEQVRLNPPGASFAHCDGSAQANACARIDTGTLHTSRLSRHDTVRNSISTARVHNSRGVFYPPHISSS